MIPISAIKTLIKKYENLSEWKQAQDLLKVLGKYDKKNRDYYIREIAVLELLIVSSSKGNRYRDLVSNLSNLDNTSADDNESETFLLKLAHKTIYDN